LRLPGGDPPFPLPGGPAGPSSFFLFLQNKKKQFQKNSQQKKQPAKYQKYMRDGVTDSRKKKGCPGFLHDQTTNFGANDFFIKIISQFKENIYNQYKSTIFSVVVILQ